MRCNRIVFSGHAVRRMFERRLDVRDIESVLSTGEVIADYPDDTPYPSCLMLGVVDERPIHVVAALEEETQTCYVITVYRPDPELWSSDFRHRRS